MVRKQNVYNFIMSGYVAFSKVRYIKRLLVLWIVGLATSLIGSANHGWMIATSCINAIVSCVFLALLFQKRAPMKMCFVCEGIFYLCISVFLCMAAYRVAVYESGANWWLFASMLVSLLACIILSLVIVFHNIKNDSYGKHTNPPKSTAAPFVSGMLGMVMASLFLHNASQSTLIRIVSAILLLLALLFSSGSMNLLKAFLVKGWEDDSFL